MIPDYAPQPTPADEVAFSAYQDAVEVELRRLAGQGSYQKRRNTVLHLAWAEVTPQVSQEEVFKRSDCVSKSTYYNKAKEWYHGELFKSVLDAVILLTRRYVEGRDGRELAYRREQLRQAEYDIFQKLYDKVGNMLEFSLEQRTETVEEEEDEDGRRVIHTTIVEPPGWRLRDTAYMMDKASTIGRRALEMTKDRETIELDLSELSDEELDELADTL